MVATPEKTFWEKHQNREFPPFLTKEERDEMVASGRPFRVLGVRTMKSTTGAQQWVIDTDASLEHEVASMSFDASDSRDEFFHDARAYLRENGSLTAILTKLPTKSGREFYVLQPAFDRQSENDGSDTEF